MTAEEGKKYGILVGMRARATKNCSGAVKGEIYTIDETSQILSLNGCTCVTEWEIIGGNMKNIWEVIVIDKTKDEIVVREIVIDGDEKSACSKVSIQFATKLKDVMSDNLAYVTKNLGNYESSKK